MKNLMLTLALFAGCSVAASATVHAAEPGDLNRDGVVSFSDLTVMHAEYGKRGASVADLNGDRVVNRRDVRILHYLLGHNGGDFTADTRLTNDDVNVFRQRFNKPGGNDADYDHSGFVSFRDLELLRYMHHADWTAEEATGPVGDHNHDGVVSLSDIPALRDKIDNGQATQLDVAKLYLVLGTNAGDLNYDARVDNTDLNLFRSRFNSDYPGADFDQSGWVSFNDLELFRFARQADWRGTGVFGDFNGDRLANIRDLAILYREKGTAGASGTDLDGNGVVNDFDVQLFAWLSGHNWGDMDHNGAVSFGDLNVLASDYGKTKRSIADFDGNGRVDYEDVRIFIYLWRLAQQYQ